MEDAIALFRAFRNHDADIQTALAEFVAMRRPQVEKLLNAAQGSYMWYEDFASKMGLPAYDLAYDYMTRSGRVSNERLEEMAPRFYAEWLRKNTQ